MILKNFYKTIEYYMSGYAPGAKVVMTNGTNVSPGSQTIAIGTYCKTLITKYGSGGGIILGTGNTPPTTNDYALSGDIITGISGSITFSNSSDDIGSTATFVITVVNNNTDPITVNEIGAITHTTSANQTILVDRTVLESPVTIPADGVGQITYTIRIDLPTV